MQIKTIVIDDTPLAIEKLERFIRQTPSLELVSTFTSALEALQYMYTNPVDLVFLDIQMEEFTGLQFLDALQEHPQIIIVSAYSQYAIAGFEHNVTDYLLKPYSQERFLKSVDKVIKQHKATSGKSYTFVKTEYRMERIDFSNIIYIAGQGAYLQIVLKEGGKIMTIMSFDEIMNQLPDNNFIRVHRSYIVAIDKINSVERNVILIDKQRIPISKSYQDEFYRKI